MILEYIGARISCIETVFPSNEIQFADEIDNYPGSELQSLKLQKIFNFKSRRLAADSVTVSDLVVHGFESLFDKNNIDRESIDGLVVVTQTPDYLVPGTSFIIQGLLGLRTDITCLDINQGCAGFVIGLTVCFSLLTQPSINRVALVNADILSKLVSKHDRNSRPLIGDAASITIVDSISNGDLSVNTIYGNIYTDGSRWEALMIPAGGMRNRPSDKTSKLFDDGTGNLRSLEHLVMRGDAVFSFVMETVPHMIEGLLKDAGIDKDSVDKFLFHQPNSFMLKKLAQKLDIDIGKVPHSLVSLYGNSSGASIPAVMCTELSTEYFEQPRLLCISGFGVGLTCASLLLKLNCTRIGVTVYPC